MSYQFYKSIGSPKFISAPMVDHSSLAWRLLVRNFGADLAYTEMLQSKSMIASIPYQNQHIDWGVNNYNRTLINTNTDTNTNTLSTSLSTKYLDINPIQLETPLIAQLAGNNIKELVDAGRILLKHGNISAIDLNLGCPQKCARKGSYGAYLLLKKSEPIEILKELVIALDIPITAKIRRFDSGNNSSSSSNNSNSNSSNGNKMNMNDSNSNIDIDGDNATIEFCQEIEQTGVSMLTIHGRSVDAIKHKVGPSDWEIIKKVKQYLPNMPLVANGGIQTYDDVLNCLEYTNADGVMSSEGLLENPRGLFNSHGAHEYQHDYIKTQLDSARLFIQVCV